MRIFSLLFIGIVCIFSLCARHIVPFSVNPTTNHMEVEVFVNNDTVPFNFILDTGCSTVTANTQNRRLMGLLNLCENDTVEYAHSSAIVSKTASDNKLMLGSLEVDSIQIVADDAKSTDYDGVIGQQLLGRFSKVGIFPDSKIIVFCEKEEPLRIANALKLPLVKGAGVYGTNLSIKTDSCEVQSVFMLDTGFGGILSVNSDFSNNHNLPNILKKIGNLSSKDGAGVESNILLATAPRLVFANESMPLLPIILDQEQFQNEWESIFSGLIGYDLLKRFNTIWDFENLTLTITPNFDFFSPFSFIETE